MGHRVLQNYFPAFSRQPKRIENKTEMAENEEKEGEIIKRRREMCMCCC